MSRKPTPKTWQSLGARDGDPAILARAAREFEQELPVGAGAREPGEGAPARRDFFKLMGLSAAAALAACRRAPVGKVIPFVDPPNDVTPGMSRWYASSCGGCAAGCGVLLKVRDGRPIKLEGNDSHPVTNGGACVVGQASILSLYDASRARGPSSQGKPVTWAALDAEVQRKLAALTTAGRELRVVVPVQLGPTAERALKTFVEANPTAKVVRFESFPMLAPIADAHLQTHGARVVPSYRFEAADVIVSLGADFLGTWVSPVAFTQQWARGRAIAQDASKRKISRLWQLESTMSLTGSNADARVVIAPADTPRILAELARRVLLRLGHRDAAAIEALLRDVPRPELEAGVLDPIVDDLCRAKGAALVVTGSDDPAAQILANVLDELLGAYGSTIELGNGAVLEGGQSFDAFFGELRAGKIAGVVLVGVNPVHAHPQGAELGRHLGGLELSVSLCDRLDETAVTVMHVAPDHHYLESWGDVSTYAPILGVRQPTISPLFDTRGAFESLLRWVKVDVRYYDFMRARWESEVRGRADDQGKSFDDFWDRSVRDGHALLVAPRLESSFRAPDPAASRPRDGVSELELVLYQKVGVRDAEQANNAWLQELPDPVTKATWANYACVSPAAAARLGVSDGDVVDLKTANGSARLPILIQPGQHPRVVAVAVGYGRTAVGPIGNGVGARVAGLARVVDGRLSTSGVAVGLVRTGQNQPLALTQTHASLEGRPHVEETTLAELASKKEPGASGEEKPRSIWSLHQYGAHRWAMFVDLNACTGCSACVVSCQAENNIPSVGVDEVRRSRDMAWMRIDRYYEGSPDAPRVLHQPMMCQHCENAPCETVCPVLATVHSSEGLNQQVYNRCVGTRYCANNCPPKVRRFNWFDYPHDDELARMVLNPDVVVRTRGVMEKCSLCVQRIQEGKAQAKLDGRPLRDGEIRTACQQSCPAQAIRFGDVNAPESEVTALLRDERAYRILEELNIGPSVRYLAKVRNEKEGG